MYFFEQVLNEVCSENGITLKKYCDGYCYKLSKNNKFTFIYYNVFENNGASIYKILKDKSALYELLTSSGVPCVEHFYISKQESKTSKKLILFLDKYKKLVVKHNEGMSGNNVYLVLDEKSLNEISAKIIDLFGAVSISPYYQIKHEYRVVVLNNNVELVFDKIRPFVIGNGIDNLSTLIKQKYPTLRKIDKNLNLDAVPENNQQVLLSWRHNLNFGSVPEVIYDKNIISNLSKIAVSAAKALNINYACIDIIETDKNEFKVLEINGSVTMEKFASFSAENYNKAKDIIKKAVLSNLANTGKK